MPENERYLGDGVYGTFDKDSGMIKLDLRAQDDTVIWLEPEVLAALVEFAIHHGITFRIHTIPDDPDDTPSPNQDQES